MDSQGNLPLRGRGAFIAAALKKAREAKPGPIEVSEPSGSSSGDAESPRPRGRAALIETLKKMKAIKIGGDGDKAMATPSKPLDLEPEMEDQTPKDYIGETGKRVPASANYIRLNRDLNLGVFEYEVKFDPIIDSKSAKYKMLSKEIVQYSKCKVFDGVVLYLPMKVFDTEVKIVTHPFDDTPVQMTIIYKRKKRMDECIHLYNVLFKRIMNILNFMRVGRQYFDNKSPFPIPQHKLEVWPGYVTAVNEFSGGIMLCLDVAHRVLRTQNVANFMYEIMQSQRDRAKDIITKALIGSAVLTRYNNQTYIIHDLKWDINPQCSFETNNGPVKYIDYYKRQYNIDIQDKDQPMLVNRQAIRVPGKIEKEDRLILLVPELSYMTGLSDEMRSDFRIMKDIAQFTRVTPNQRMNSLRKFINSINQNPEAKDVLASWGLTIETATIDLQMRILDPENILFGNDVRVHGTIEADWTSAAMKNHVISAIDLQKWLIIYTRQDEKLAGDFTQTVSRLGPKMGIKIAPPMRYCMHDDRTETYVRTLQEKISSDLQIIVFICPTSRDDRYMAIKKICCHKIPIASQVINARTLKNTSKLPAITQKIALQMNCKLGGTLWSVRFPFKSWMICGYDVYHSTSLSGKAVCGFVSSINESITRWYSSACFHNSDKELGDHLKPLFIKSLEQFKHQNLNFPSHVIIYRDGIGDGQLNVCKQFEIRQFREAIKDLNLDIKLIFIVVQKRINTRMFTKDRDNVTNPIPGSITDHTITRKCLYDFFLVAQHVRQGTVTPTHYIVLHDDTTIKPDNIQRLTFKLCHMYYNWTGTVRVPAPCQYGHKLAYLIGQVVRTEHSETLSNRLFYL